MFKMTKHERELRESRRGRYLPHPAWYAVLTHANREGRVREQMQTLLDDRGDVLLPELAPSAPRGRTPRKPPSAPVRPRLLFGCHVFLRCSMHDALYAAVSDLPDVFRILGASHRIPSVIPDAEMAAFLAALRSVPVPSVVAAIRIGQWAQVSEGLLAGMRGRVVSASATHLRLATEYSFLENQSVIVAVPRGCVFLEPTRPAGAEAAGKNAARGGVQSVCSAGG